MHYSPAVYRSWPKSALQNLLQLWDGILMLCTIPRPSAQAGDECKVLDFSLAQPCCIITRTVAERTLNNTRTGYNHFLDSAALVQPLFPGS